MPRTISHTLIYNVSLKRLHLLPHQFAAVFGQPFAIRLGRGNVGIGVVITRTDCDGAQGPRFRFAVPVCPDLPRPVATCPGLAVVFSLAVLAEPHVANLIRVRGIVVKRKPCLAGRYGKGLRLNAADEGEVGQQVLRCQLRRGIRRKPRPIPKTRTNLSTAPAAR